LGTQPAEVAFAKERSLDPTGNWPGFKQDTDGDGTWELEQSRTHDTANQTTQIDGSSTHVAEDAAGNMTKIPKPTSWSAHYDLTWDAWNRPVEAPPHWKWCSARSYQWRRSVGVHTGWVESFGATSRGRATPVQEPVRRTVVIRLRTHLLGSSG
jgi:hypothetical protein